MSSEVLGAFGGVADQIRSAIDGVISLSIPIFGLLMLISIALLVFRTPIENEIQKRRDFADFEHDFDEVNEQARRTDNLFEWLGIDDDAQYDYDNDEYHGEF